MRAGAPGRGGPPSAGQQETPPERTPGWWTHFSPPQFSLILSHHSLLNLWNGKYYHWKNLNNLNDDKS